MDHRGHQGQTVYLSKVILKACFFLEPDTCLWSALLNQQSKLQLILKKEKTNTAPS